MLKTAFAGVRRFSAFEESLSISKSRLQDRLTRLIEHGILVKQPSAHGAHDEYRLTPKGVALYPILMAIKDWGDEYMAPDGPPVHYRHADCGGEAHALLTCSECGVALTARDVIPEAGPGMTA
ncbi:HxlR-like helix-turn-helix [Tsukamurella paurometabola]|uniref:HxlR-like helix-turn-helix n=1 Tax=Tsukamurella paurometabola TaxID=2061 RepID=A0A3P8KFB7_TSUPA|nr:HxlR-like helix-turn-helix [Tsukamurella paurometabola]